MRREIKYLLILLIGILIGYTSALINVDGLGSKTYIIKIS